MALRVSAVPPDLEMTSARVLRRLDAWLIFLSVVSQPWGSVLSRKKVLSLLLFPSAS